jgi:hypothetical protein
MASARNAAGARAEELAADYLVAHGLTIVTRNFRRRRGRSTSSRAMANAGLR